MKRGRIAVLGSRGVPARYGGYETLAEELSARLVALGFEVTVYTRRHYAVPGVVTHRGARVQVLPSLRFKHLDTPSHTALSALDAAARRFDAALVLNSANAVFVPLLRAAGIPTALHVDGIERQRSKWGLLGRAVYSASERLAASAPDRLITDADAIRRYYLERYRADSTMLTYGVDPRPAAPGKTLAGLGLAPRRYVLYVSRFEPENNPHRVVAEYRHVAGDLPLVMVGGAPYAESFIREFQAGADPRVLFPGPVYGEGYRELQSNATLYIHATEVGGTHPALVEAMGFGNCVVVNDTPENREAAGDAGIYFSAHEAGSLARTLTRLLADPGAIERRRREARDHAASRYDWDQVAAAYADLFDELAGGSAGSS